ncbi:MAG TPA: DivIVA domain-containing protein [Thermoleophilia bacterium]|nr:DivIVA domain-containing protein [Thermoleophilia bacterium]
MKITAMDIRRKEFKRGRRGYADAEVDEFLDQVADEYEHLSKENLALTESVRALNERVTGYTLIEDALQKALVSAQTSAEEVKRQASEAAQLVLHEAELKARQMMNAAHSEKQTVEQAIVKARNLEEDFRLAFRQMLQGYLSQAEQAPESVSSAATGVADARSDFARHADAIRETINREESSMLVPEVASAPPAPVAVDAEQDRTETPADASAPSPEAAGDAAPQTPPSGRRPGEGVRILFGERDDLLADVDSKVDENGFTW